MYVGQNDSDELKHGPAQLSSDPGSIQRKKVHLPTGIDLYSRLALAGAIGSGVTHAALTPADVVKTRIQLEPVVYNKRIIVGFRKDRIRTNFCRLLSARRFHVWRCRIPEEYHG